MAWYRYFLESPNSTWLLMVSCSGFAYQGNNNIHCNEQYSGLPRLPLVQNLIFCQFPMIQVSFLMHV